MYDWTSSTVSMNGQSKTAYLLIVFIFDCHNGKNQKQAWRTQEDVHD